MKRKLFLPVGLALLLCSCANGNPSSSITSKSSIPSSSTSSVVSSSSSTKSSSASSSEVSSSITSSPSSESSSSVIPAVGFNVTFSVDEHVSYTVYTTKSYDVVDTDTNIQTRNGDTGEYCNDGVESQVNFKLVVEDGYEIESIIGTTGTYNKVKWPADTEVENGYRVTKITADTTITITSKSKQAEPEGYKVSFVLEHCTVQVHIGKDTSTTDTPDKSGNYFTRDKDTGEYTKNTDTAQINFTIIPEAGYEFNSGIEEGGEAKASTVAFISGSYNKLKNNGSNYFTATKVQGDLVITLACSQIL